MWILNVSKWVLSIESHSCTPVTILLSCSLWSQGEEDNTTGNEAASPGDANAGNRSTDVMSVNGHMKGKSLSSMC